jgi:hypothetical protein
MKKHISMILVIVIALSYLAIGGLSAVAGTAGSDLCQDAPSVGVPSNNAGTTSGATSDIAPSCDDGPGAPGVWYAVTGTGNTLTASLCNNTSYDSILDVYCGDCQNLTCVASDDDFCSPFGPSQVSWCSEAGVTYRILVNGFNGGTGNFELAISDDGSPCTPSVVCENGEGGACEEAQQAAQDAVDSGGPYRNHGKLVKTAAKAASPFLKSGAITEECDSCIVNQFARNIPIGEQEVCTDSPPPACCVYDDGGTCCEPPVTDPLCEGFGGGYLDLDCECGVKYPFCG